MIVHKNKEGLTNKINPFIHGSRGVHTKIMKTDALKQALDLNKFDVAFGGARRDEEKSRSKEFSHLEHLIINGILKIKGQL